MAAFTKASVTTNNPSTVCSEPDLETLYFLYRKCKRKSYYKNGRPRPCRSQRCPCETCRRKYSEKEAAILLRSFKDQPPDYTFVLKLVDDEPTYDVMMAVYLNAFTQKIRDFRKSDGIAVEYEIRIEFRHGEPHCHVTVITPADWSRRKAKRLVKGWWKASCPRRTISVYADRVHTVIGHGNYVTKNVKDRRTVEMPPQEWSGKKCRFVRRSGGFLSKTKKELWREQCEEWYPKPTEPDTERSVGDMEDADASPAPEAPISSPEQFRQFRRPAGRPTRLRPELGHPMRSRNRFWPLIERRGWPLPRGP
jgi:hypothetical protein